MRVSSPCAKAFVLAFSFALVLVFTPSSGAQDAAAVTGIITDTSGALVAGVKVTLRNASTGATFQTETDAEGSYTFRNIAPGPNYTLTFERSGFAPFTITGVYLNVNMTRTQNVKLRVGSATQTIEVSAKAEGETLNTTDATIGNNVQVSMLNELPIQFRDSPSALFYQQPGVTLDGAVTGARTDQSNVTVDGLETNDDATGQFGYIVAKAPVDSVQEFRGVVADPLASSGQGSGGQFELVTKSGTNRFHGNLNEYHRDTDTEANDWFNNNIGVPRPPLIRNQFGGNLGGPIWRNKAFFFFDYDGRRDTRSYLVERTVPMGTDTSGYRGGQLAYVNSGGSITILDASQVAALDPQHIGWDQAELKLFQSRFPQANDLSGAYGDLVNTAGYRFNAPRPYSEDVYVQRVDFNLNEKMKLFGKATLARTNSLENPIQFPGDPTYTYPFYDRSYDWTVGYTWAINQNMVNQAQVGETFEDFNFNVTYNPQGVNQYSFSGVNSWLDNPYGAGNNSQARTYPIPIVRDDFTWIKGRHSLAFGGTFKWETPDSFAAENYNFPSVGITGNTNFTALDDQLRPPDIDPNYTQIYDNAFSIALGAFADVSSNFNYNNKGKVLQQGSGQSYTYRNYETEIYFTDAWKITPNFTLTYGIRYQNYTVPYETHGNEAVPQLTSGKFTFDNYWSARLKQSASGTASDDALPFLQYIYGGKANNAPGYFHPNNKNFAPHLGLAWNPGYDKNTVFTASAGLVYDHSIINALQFQQLQTSGLFESTSARLFGTAGDPYGSLASSPDEGGLPRFGGIDNPPAAPDPLPITVPFTPYVSEGTGYGLPEGQLNMVIDPNLKTPYSIEYNFGIQHQFAEGFILKMNYDARLGRRLLAEADASQVLDFPDNSGGSDQTMVQAYAAMETQLRQYPNLSAYGAATHLAAQPWFEDMLPGFADYFNAYFGGNYFANNTQAVAYITSPYAARGDISDSLFDLAAVGFLPPNAGMPTQYSDNTVWTNKGFSSYNALLVTLHKNAGHGLQFDLNYAWSHSIDNVSVVANFLADSNGYGYICDVTRPRECRGNSDFDVTNYLNGSFIYDLPFGRGRAFGGNLPFWVNEAAGGWTLSGIPTWHTGLAYNAGSNAYVASFANNAPATLIGSPALLKTKIHGGKGARLNAFASPSSALAAYTGPVGLDMGSRNNLRGPGYFNMDLGLGKTFPLRGDRVNLKFRCDAFNAFNHPNFGLPNVDITQSSGVPFGTISSTVIPPGSDLASRVLQGALRLEF